MKIAIAGVGCVGRSSAVLLAQHNEAVAAGIVPDKVDMLAANFTASFTQLKAHWDLETRSKLKASRHPLAFKQVTTIRDHATHLRTVDYVAKTARPAIVIAASGMCSAGRMPQGHAGRRAARRAVLRLPGRWHTGA